MMFRREWSIQLELSFIPPYNVGVGEWQQCAGELYEPRFEMADAVGGRYKVMMVAISLRIASWLVFKRWSLRGTL